MPNYGQYGADSTWKDRFNQRQFNNIKRNFHKSDGYCLVDVTTPSLDGLKDVPIHIFNPSIRTIGVKQLVCHPDYPLAQGSVINYIDGKKYILIDSDAHQSIQVFGKAQLCNTEFNWVDENGELQVEYGIDNMSLGAQDFARQVPEVDNKKKVWLQNNQNTTKLKKDFRFVFGGNEAYKISYVENWSKEGLIMFTLETTQLLPQDDLINNIAYNGTPIYTPQPINDIQFSVSELSIIQDFTGAVTATIVDDPLATFTFTISDLPPTSYEITSTTDNSISIKCKEFYHKGTLRATNNSNPTQFAEIPIVLRGLF